MNPEDVKIGEKLWYYDGQDPIRVTVTSPSEEKGGFLVRRELMWRHVYAPNLFSTREACIEAEIARQQARIDRAQDMIERLRTLL